MRIAGSAWFGLGAGGLLLTVAVGAALGAAALAGDGDSGPADESAGRGSALTLTNGFLLTENRDRLAICVQAAGVDPSLEPVARDNIEVALEEVARHPYWEPAGFADLPPPLVVAGCPSGPRLPDKVQSSFPIADIRAEFVSLPSYYRIFVFILPPAELRWLIGGSTLRQTSYEDICSGDVCHEVTIAVYVDSDEATDVEALVPILAENLGLGSSE